MGIAGSRDMQRISRELRKTGWSTDLLPSLPDLVATSFSSKCEEARDHVYALLPLADARAEGIVKIDYTKSSITLFEEVMSLLYVPNLLYSSRKTDLQVTDLAHLGYAWRIQKALGLEGQDLACIKVLNGCLDADYKDDISWTLFKQQR
jgi:hypothetical protein